MDTISIPLPVGPGISMYYSHDAHWFQWASCKAWFNLRWCCRGIEHLSSVSSTYRTESLRSEKTSSVDDWENLLNKRNHPNWTTPYIYGINKDIIMLLHKSQGYLCILSVVVRIKYCAFKGHINTPSLSKWKGVYVSGYSLRRRYVKQERVWRPLSNFQIIWDNMSTVNGKQSKGFLVCGHEPDEYLET